MNRNCITYWLPKIRAANVPIPRTEIIKTQVELWRMLDGALFSCLADSLEEARAQRDQWMDGRTKTQ